MVKLEVGKYYKTREGQKVGPMVVSGDAWLYEDDQNGRLWNYDGSRYYGDPDGVIIAEWTEEPTGPVRTVTRKEIVPGVYGKVSVHRFRGDSGEAYMAFVDNKYHKENTVHSMMSAPALRAAIVTLTEIADALEQK